MKNIVHLKYRDGHIESLKCKDAKRAKEIADKRPNVISHKFYSDSRDIPRAKKKVKQEKKMSLAEMEQIIRTL